MLDHFTIATKGGIVLWDKQYASVVGHPIQDLIQTTLIPRTTTTTTTNNKYQSGSYTLQWSFANELSLVFVAVYQKILQLPYMEDLLKHVRLHFVKRFQMELQMLADSDTFPDFSQFEEEFEQICRAVEQQQPESKQTARVPRRFEDTKKFQSTVVGAQQELEALARSGEMDLGKRERKMRTWNDRPGRKKKGKRGKEDRVWDDGRVTKESMQALDYSGSTDGDASRVSGALVDEGSRGSRTADGVYEVADIKEPSEGFVLLDDQEAEAPQSSGVLGMFRSLARGRVLTAEILDRPMSQMREHLAAKNVATDIAEEICQSVARGMLGVRVGGLQSVRQLVEQTMEQTLTRILTPASSTDIIRDIAGVRGTRPYTMAFVGVNGVGKSTNLSKVCYWLLQNNMRVLIAACDTFRAGAVEQLRVHARNLRALSETNPGVEIFERGYGKDSASIARDAVAWGAEQGFDMVLIDTAGRMQDNEPLMRALAKLVSVNSPDKILFVGEALVGNEAIDQLAKFNQALSDFSGQSSPRHIDGIILTKFDTIDDRVGAALSMTYSTGQPILFVGTGQTYTDLRKMNVGQVTRALLK